MKGESPDAGIDSPHKNGFVFSTAEITRTIRRACRLKLARRAESSNRNQSAPPPREDDSAPGKRVN